MSKQMRRRIEVLENRDAPVRWRLPTLDEFYAGYMNDGDVLPNGEVIRLPPGTVSWNQFYENISTILS